MINIDKKIVIAIDGLAATGKSSLAKSVARKLNILYIDTGAMYRAVALYFLTNKIEIKEDVVKNYLKNIHIDIDYDENGKMKIILNNEDVSDKIRNEEVSKYASIVAQIQIVRDFLIERQRQLGRLKSVVMDGRDIGSVVFKDADVKLFITTDVDVKTARRLKDYAEKNIVTTFEEVKEEIINRDKRDEKNTKVSKDATILDTTNFTIEEATSEALKIIEKTINSRNS